jgi:hypothetical protein
MNRPAFTRRSARPQRMLSTSSRWVGVLLLHERRPSRAPDLLLTRALTEVLRSRNALVPPPHPGWLPLTEPEIENVQGYWFLYQSCPAVHRSREQHRASLKGAGTNANREIGPSARRTQARVLLCRPAPPLAIPPNLVSLGAEIVRIPNRHSPIRNRRNVLKIKERRTI